MSRFRFGAAIFLAITGPAFAQRYPILPVPNSPRGIYAMMQDSTSRLWLGTIDDLFAFDGVRFFPMRAHGYPRETATGFAEDDEGGIWIVTQGTAAGGGSGHGGLYRYAEGRITRIFSGDCLSVVRAAPGMMMASFGTELVGKPAYGDLYLFREQGSEWKPLRLASAAANHFTASRNGDILFPCPSGWCEVPASQITQARSVPAAVKPVSHSASPLIERVLRDRFGCLWFRAEAFASYQCPGMKAPVNIPDTISQIDSSAHLEEAPDGSIFMLVKLALGRPGHFKIATVQNGMPTDLDSAIVGRDGTIWLGTDSGLFRFMYPFQLEYWNRDHGLASASSLVRIGARVYASSAGSILVLTDDRQRWIPWGPVSVLGAVAKLAAGPSGTLLAASRHRLAQLDSYGSILARSPWRESGPFFATVASSDRGEIWFGDSGVSRAVKQGFEFRLIPEPLPRNGVRDLQFDREHGILWACDGKELLARESGHWRRLSSPDGLSDLNCYSIAFDKTGSLWLSYDAPSFALLRDPLAQHPAIINFDAGLNANKANSGTHFMGADKRGWLWRNSDVQYVADRISAQQNTWLSLSPSDGVPGGGGTNAFLADPDGSVWISGEDMVVHLSLPDSFVEDFKPPPVFVSGFSIGQGPPLPSEALPQIPYGKTILAYVGSLQFNRRGAMLFRHRLLPDALTWMEHKQTEIALPELSWGAHRLEIQARVATGPWSVVEAKSFEVLKPVWLWPRMILAEALLATLTLAGTLRWKSKRAARRKKLFPDIAELRLKALSPELQGIDGLLLDGRYELGRVLARGGFATVVDGRDMRGSGRRCAVKIFRHESGDDEWVRRRFRQEVAVLEQISHPGVVSIYGHGTTPAGALYLVMEFVDGKTLRDVLRGGALARKTVACYLRQIAGALKAIHIHNVIHRDLKPENLMIRNTSLPGEEVVLIDFSIAIVKDPDQTMHGLSRAAGTLRYMAPEQSIGYADNTSDIYSLAKIVIEMLTGRQVSDLLPDASIDLPLRVREVLSARGEFHFCQASIDLMSRALQFDPGNRPKDVEEFVQQIAADLDS